MLIAPILLGIGWESGSALVSQICGDQPDLYARTAPPVQTDAASPKIWLWMVIENCLSSYRSNCWRSAAPACRSSTRAPIANATPSAHTLNHLHELLASIAVATCEREELPRLREHEPSL